MAPESRLRQNVDKFQAPFSRGVTLDTRTTTRIRRRWLQQCKYCAQDNGYGDGTGQSGISGNSRPKHSSGTHFHKQKLSGSHHHVIDTSKTTSSKKCAPHHHINDQTSQRNHQVQTTPYRTQWILLVPWIQSTPGPHKEDMWRKATKTSGGSDTHKHAGRKNVD